MSATAANGIPVGRIHAILDSLIEERRRLRADRHEASLFEANRMAIAYWRQQLERARDEDGGQARAGLDR